ncbi:hypothetical protein MtrunA17_Chr8g0356631 [Medicago truncatula]|uniref:PB1-like domain-containing protein n=1 Tax=Medicago truncatula TaxID=3880 RepID=A0A396GPH7_MEDTR|nr:hypothetical protein MtrunA17_Chr8g0356631 [Medicago truncatula]
MEEGEDGFVVNPGMDASDDDSEDNDELEGRFVLVVHHGGVFVDFNHMGYNGTEIVLECEPDYWAYFSILSTLKRLGYPMVRSLWYHDPNLVDDLIRLRSDIGCRRMMHIAEMYDRVHLYVEHTVGEEPVMGELNPLIEYPIQNVGANVGGNGGVHVEEIFEEEVNQGNGGNEGNLGVHVEEMEEIFEEVAIEGNCGMNVEEYFEEEMAGVNGDGNTEMINMGGDNAEGINEGWGVEGEVDCGANGDGNLGPTLVDDIGNLRQNIGPSVLEESEHVGTTVDGEGIFNGPTTLNVGSNEAGPSAVVSKGKTVQ